MWLRAGGAQILPELPAYHLQQSPSARGERAIFGKYFCSASCQCRLLFTLGENETAVDSANRGGIVSARQHGELRAGALVRRSSSCCKHRSSRHAKRKLRRINKRTRIKRHSRPRRLRNEFCSTRSCVFHLEFERPHTRPSDWWKRRRKAGTSQRKTCVAAMLRVTVSCGLRGSRF